MDEHFSHDSKKKKSRPSRGRGLRTTTGCLTCRKRRLKCDEGRPNCGQCAKSDRECVYARDLAAPHEDTEEAILSPVPSKQDSWSNADAIKAECLHSSPELSSTSHGSYSGLSNSTPTQVPPLARSGSLSNEVSRPLPQNLRQGLSHSPSGYQSQLHQHDPANKLSPAQTEISPLTQAASVTPNRAPYEWWDLLAHDATKSAESYQALKDNNSRWSFDPVNLSRSSAPSPHQFLHSKQQNLEQLAQPPIRPILNRGNGIGSNHDNVSKEPWNTSAPLRMPEQELRYLKYYIDYVGPIFDLFDPDRTFTGYIPHLALRNVGLLKSVLAVSARFKSLHTKESTPNVARDSQPRHRSSFTDEDDAVATQFYFETLGYLAQAMQYQSYTRSQEILATAVLISSYELFNRSSDWEKHLKGVFWIQRSQDTNGEREGLRGAVWWAWLRQDLWAALWQNRKPLTIWEPTKPVSALRSHEFASRATYMFARAINYATQDSRDGTDLSRRIAEGEKYLQDLQEWYSLLPPTYRPLPTKEGEEATCVFPPVWVHPPHHAAALQHYFSAVILIVQNRPSAGGMDAYHAGQRMINEAISMICGLAQAPTAMEFPSAMVHSQALYVAGRCVVTSERQKALRKIFERILESNRFPPKSVLSDLENLWAPDSH